VRRIDGEQDQEGGGTDGALFIGVRPACATLAPPGLSTGTSGRTLGPLLSSVPCTELRSSSGLA
jgi:hypothetical protein